MKLNADDLVEAHLSKMARVDADVQHLFEGWFTQSPGPKAALDKAMPSVRKGIAGVVKALQKELHQAQTGPFEFNPPRYPQDLEQMHRLMTNYILRRYGVTKQFASGLAHQIVYGENY